jgi:hypothetical protein
VIKTTSKRAMRSTTLTAWVRTIALCPLVSHTRSVANHYNCIAGLAWYTSSNADFERGNSVCHFCSATLGLPSLQTQGESSDGTKKEGLRPVMYKTVQPPINDFNFRSICQGTETRVLFAHIRAASGTAITPVNCHPFVFGRHSKYGYFFPGELC